MINTLRMTDFMSVVRSLKSWRSFFLLLYKHSYYWQSFYHFLIFTIFPFLAKFWIGDGTEFEVLKRDLVQMVTFTLWPSQIAELQNAVVRINEIRSYRHGEKSGSGSPGAKR